MGYHPQIYCSGSHSTGRSIRSQLLHRPMRTATPIIIHCSATSQAWPRASNKGGLGLYNILTGSMIICDIFHKIHILFDKREKTYQVVLAIIKFVSRKLFHNPLFQILRKIGTNMSCNALHCHLFHIMFHHDTYQLFKRSFHRIPSQLLTGFSGISPKVHHIRRAIEILRHLYQHTSVALSMPFSSSPSPRTPVRYLRSGKPTDKTPEPNVAHLWLSRNLPESCFAE